ncbi:HAMP domain-containing histidine kinase [Amycolatopsis sp. FBCC-B4732]|uniref:sensor histidine kinase n=1 Tax=Amycolatopsis sp. FBCC-B4732 TaxID=3079339 RepID=UPI001FF15597|nr:HAMP domain-containing sensor histidine kinase [Amycolatopsis sp. FBCC-B4732]UOX90935.1 HAMP domain-containing histidine kinase [Amycolatopsis sp. FBCC-B4732]
MNRSSADRLRRLRWALTALFTAVNAIGLVAFAWFMIGEDADKGTERIDAELLRVTSSVSRLVGYDAAIDLSLVNTDVLNEQCPQFAILPGGAAGFQAHLSRRTCVPVDAGVLDGLATEAVRGGTVVTGYQRGTGGELVQVRAEPLLSRTGKPFAAVVAVADTAAASAEHTRFVLLVVGGCALLVTALGFAGHVLSGRSIRPAASALQQQEVLLAETAHDLRTPVAALRALAETAMLDPAQRTDLLPRTVRLAARMGGIIDDLLVRARLAAGVEQLSIQPVWLDQLVAGVVEDTEPDGAQVTVTTAPTKVNADPALVQRAVGNLLNNALRYGRQPGAPAIVHVMVAGGTVTVADHGPGIDTTVTEDAFDRFASTGGSSGLGLSIVRWVAEAHGGTLSVYNADEGGAIFELRFPVIAV